MLWVIEIYADSKYLYDQIWWHCETLSKNSVEVHVSTVFLLPLEPVHFIVDNLLIEGINKVSQKETWNAHYYFML